MKISPLLEHRLVVASRQVLGELGAGLAVAWLWLFLLELARPMLAAPYLNMNWLLVVGAGLWLVGTRPSPGRRPGYGAAAASAILVGAASFVLTAEGPHRLALTGLTALATFYLWLLACASESPAP